LENKNTKTINMKAEKFKTMEKVYNLWLAKHPKGDHNYKSFSHMRRSIEFAEHWHKLNVHAISNEIVEKHINNHIGIHDRKIGFRRGILWLKQQLLKQ
jgi:hypothetical protein